MLCFLYIFCRVQTHWAHDVVTTLNQRQWRWFNVVTTSCVRWKVFRLPARSLSSWNHSRAASSISASVSYASSLSVSKHLRKSAKSLASGMIPSSMPIPPPKPENCAPSSPTLIPVSDWINPCMATSSVCIMCIYQIIYQIQLTLWLLITTKVVFNLFY